MTRAFGKIDRRVEEFPAPNENSKRIRRITERHRSTKEGKEKSRTTPVIRSSRDSLVREARSARKQRKRWMARSTARPNQRARDEKRKDKRSLWNKILNALREWQDWTRR